MTESKLYSEVFDLVVENELENAIHLIWRDTCNEQYVAEKKIENAVDQLYDVIFESLFSTQLCGELEWLLINSDDFIKQELESELVPAPKHDEPDEDMVLFFKMSECLLDVSNSSSLSKCSDFSMNKINFSIDNIINSSFQDKSFLHLYDYIREFE
jgi:hypothetical protein